MQIGAPIHVHTVYMYMHDAYTCIRILFCYGCAMHLLLADLLATIGAYLVHVHVRVVLHVVHVHVHVCMWYVHNVHYIHLLASRSLLHVEFYIGVGGAGEPSSNQSRCASGAWNCSARSADGVLFHGICRDSCSKPRLVQAR